MRLTGSARTIGAESSIGSQVMDDRPTFEEARQEILRVLVQEPFDAWRSVHLEQAIRLLRRPARPYLAFDQARRAERAPAERSSEELAEFDVANKDYAFQSRDELKELLRAVCA